MKPRRLLFNAFAMNCVSHIQQGLWVRPEARQRDYKVLDLWVELARLLERGRFDALFLADVTGVYDTYRGGGETALRSGMQTPANDPAMLVSAMAYATEHLGFAYTSSIYQHHPFVFARQLSTLDHLTRGRVAWNIVTSYLDNGARSRGLDRLPGHDERYDQADEYMEVLYKLWEGSWEEDAVVMDTRRGVYADPGKVHPIHHSGRYYRCLGPHLSEPSAQRTPLLFQAGSSARGREFAARHAECVFIVTSRGSLRGPQSVVADVRRRAERWGRRPEDLRFFQGLSPVVGGTEAGARRKEREYLEQIDEEAVLAHLSGSMGVDLSAVDPDRPLETIENEGVRGFIKDLLDSAPSGKRTLGDLVRRRMAGQFLTGAPEQIADALASWAEAGIDGFNLVYSVLPGTFSDFIEGVGPVLVRRGLMQAEYTPGPLREKLFGAPRLPDRHPGAAFRGLGAARS